MADSYTQSAGAKLSIGDSSSSPIYTVVAGITNFGEFGRQYERGTFNPVKDRRTRKYKGSYDEGSFTLDLARDLTDQGQTDMMTALDSDDPVPIKIELDDAPAGSGTNPTSFKFDALVMSFTTNIGGTNDYVSAQVQIEITSDITETAAA
ncbi:MAG: hypothetical protein U5L06_00645 [Rhodovibrio sp.]|nr:hypothetical protein [Rhodovibrio sp.]